MPTYQGTQAEIMQALADHIGKLNERVTVLEDRAKVHMGVISMIGGTFKVTNPQLLEAFVGTVSRLRDFHANADNYAVGLSRGRVACAAETYGRGIRRNSVSRFRWEAGSFQNGQGR